MCKLLVQPCCVTCCDSAEISIPLTTHCPACSIVCIERNRIGIILNLLQCRDKLCRCLWQFCHTCIRENFLIVKDSLSITHISHTIAVAFKFPLVCKVNVLWHLIHCSIWNEVICKLYHVDRRDKHNIAPCLSCRKS